MTPLPMHSYIAGVLDANARIYDDSIAMRLLSPGMGKDFKREFGGQVSAGRWRVFAKRERRTVLRLWAEHSRYREREVAAALDALDADR